MNKKNTHILSSTLLSMFCVAACHAKPAEKAVKNEAPEIQQRVQLLKAKTLKDLVSIKGGKFMMGDFGPIDPRVRMPYSGDQNDDVLREVTLSDYSLGAYKVTYEDFDTFTEATGREKVAQQEMDVSYRDLPNIAAGVNWQDAQDYCRWIGQQVNKPMDLPTEAQWEYAARNRGKMIVWPTDTGIVENGRNVADFNHYSEFSAKYNSTAKASSVGLFPPTALGLYDLIDHGFEWMRDWYAPSYVPRETTNPVGPATGSEKVQRSHSSRGGDTLALVSMTMTRFHSNPSPPPQKSAFDENAAIPVNQNKSNTFRCAQN
ncbi:MAG: formylglycine-generating enzyme family protein [Stenotrophomonas sp.]